MSTVRHQPIMKNTPGHGAHFVPVLNGPSEIAISKWLIILCAFFLMPNYDRVVWRN